MNISIPGGTDAIAAATSAVQGLAHAKKAAAAGANGSSATTGTPITSADFLKLLVTEMKNQDLTQPTDPNAYIQQLVGVNSLQQLISINQRLGTATTNPASAAISAVDGSALQS